METGPEPRMNPTGTADARGDVDPRLFVGTLGKGMQVLQAFREQSRGLSLTEVSALTGLGRSTVQRFLYTFRVLGYLRQDPRTRRFSLTPRMLDFGYAYLRNDYLVEKAFPYLLEASKRTEETVNLTELDDTEIVYVSRFPAREVVSVDIVLGERLPVFSTSSGRAMLAFLPPNQARDILARSRMRPFTPHTCTDTGKIERELADIRERGYAISDQQTFIGDMSVAAPVLTASERAVAAVNIAVSATRWSVEGIARDLAPVVVETARAISKALRLE